MAADFVVRFADFSGGDYGRLDPSKAAPTQFLAENMQLYNSQLLGVRPGLKPIELQGSFTHPNADSPFTFDIWQNQLVIGTDTLNVVGIVPGAPYSTTIVVGPPTLAAPVRIAEHKTNMFTNYDGDLWITDPDTPDTATAVTLPSGASQGIKNVTRWNYYLVAVDVAEPWRLWFTEVGEFGAAANVWPENNFLDIGINEPITALCPMYNYLYVGKESGWYAVSGILADRPYVRRVTMGNGPVSDRAAAVTTDNRVLYWGRTPRPVWFNGDSAYFDDEHRVEGFDNDFPADAVVASPTGRRAFMLGKPRALPGDVELSTELLQYDQGRWTTHTFDVPLGGMAGHDIRTAVNKPADVLYFINKPAGVEPVEIYTLDLELNRPGHTDDLWASPLDQSGEMVEGYVEFPAYYDPQSRQVMVRNVVVQFRHWPTGVDGTLNELHCQVFTLGNTQNTTRPAQRMWSQPSNIANDDGSDVSWTIGIGNQGWAAGFQIVLPKIRGCAIRAVEVHCEVRQARL